MYQSSELNYYNGYNDYYYNGYNGLNGYNGYNGYDSYDAYYHNNYYQHGYDQQQPIANEPYGYPDSCCSRPDYYWHPIPQSLIDDLEKYINDELKDSKYYEMLANKAPTKKAKDILMEFSKDEYMHAQNFMNAYFSLTGRMYQPSNTDEPEMPDDYEKALKERIIAETDGYKEYGEQYLKAPTYYLQALFFMARTSEAQHAMRIPILLHEKADK
ncbi:MAG: ferritin-like domain-containing protein [Clostridiales bacterium]|nr:ferritin-like domain-containing protein [Clostridiales bacterium]